MTYQLEVFALLGVPALLGMAIGFVLSRKQPDPCDVSWRKDPPRIDLTKFKSTARKEPTLGKV